MAGLAELGRFSEPALLVMISLAEGPKHGYAMQEDIAALTGERPGPGTHYGAIRRLEERGLIAALPERDRRKPYELTAAGRTTLRTELARIRVVAHAGLHRLASVMPSRQAVTSDNSAASRRTPSSISPADR